MASGVLPRKREPLSSDAVVSEYFSMRPKVSEGALHLIDRVFVMYVATSQIAKVEIIPDCYDDVWVNETINL